MSRNETKQKTFLEIRLNGIKNDSFEKQMWISFIFHLDVTFENTKRNGASLVSFRLIH